MTEIDANGVDTTIISRREMVRLLVGAGVSFVGAIVLADPLTPAVKDVLSALDTGETTLRSTHPVRWGMVIDLGKCIGCEYCVYACQATNDVTDAMRWNIYLADETSTGKQFHVTRPCLHCNNAPCVRVCPVGATYVRDDGIVIMDYDRCIGCRYCEAACPYGARAFNWAARDEEANAYSPDWGSPEVERRPRGVIEKCTFCVHRIDAGLAQGLVPGIDPEATPACVNICPVNARHFGNLNDPHSPVSRIIEETPTLRLREDLGTDASVYYIPPEGLTT